MKINPLNVYSQYEVRNQNQADNIQKLINENVSKVVPKQKQEPKKRPTFIRIEGPKQNSQPSRT